jgi:inositol oxygenase
MKKLCITFLAICTVAADYRDYENAEDTVKRFYYDKHSQQTLEFVLAKEEQYRVKNRARMGVWQAIEMLDTVVDSSDPDLHLSQIHHAMQTAEAIRRDGHPDWMILAGLIHDLGKILVVFGEPEWAVVGDTFAVGCAFPTTAVYPDYFKDNPDSHNPLYQTPNGIYKPHCGIDNLHIAWGHDEYLYQVVKDYVPAETAHIIRYHSFYPHHQHNAYAHLANEQDEEMRSWLRAFQKYDVYSKEEVPVDVAALTPYYQELIAKFFPDVIDW